MHILPQKNTSNIILHHNIFMVIQAIYRPPCMKDQHLEASIENFYGPISYTCMIKNLEYLLLFIEKIDYLSCLHAHRPKSQPPIS